MRVKGFGALGFVWAAVLVFSVLLARIPARADDSPPSGPTLEARIAQLKDEFENQISRLPSDQILGLTFGLGGQAWQATARDLAFRWKSGPAGSFLDKILNEYQKSMAGPEKPTLRDLHGLDLFYMSSNALAVILAAGRQDRDLLLKIQETEKRVRQVIGKAEKRDEILAALSGGLMAMLALTVNSLDPNPALGRVLSEELALRKKLDQNISSLQGIDLSHRKALLVNNHLFGAFSMVQIIGLSLNPDLKAPLLTIQKELNQYLEAEVLDQIQAGSRALTRAVFLVAPEFGHMAKPSAPEPEPASPPVFQTPESLKP